MGLGGSGRSDRNVTYSSEIIKGPRVRRVVISPGYQVVRSELAEQLEPGLQLFDQVVENKRIDHFVIPNTFHSSRYRLMNVSYLC